MLTPAPVPWSDTSARHHNSQRDKDPVTGWPRIPGGPVLPCGPGEPGGPDNPRGPSVPGDPYKYKQEAQ